MTGGGGAAAVWGGGKRGGWWGVRDEKGEVETYKRVRETSEGRVTERASERERGGRDTGSSEETRRE